MQHFSGGSVMFQMEFRTKYKVLPPKHVFGAQAGCGDVTSLYKNLVKNTKACLTSIGSRFRSPFFLCLIQNLKAVAMGVVAAIAFFWSHGPNPAIYKNLVKNRKTNFLRQAIQEPIFFCGSTDFEVGGDGRGRGVRYFFGHIGPTRPYSF
jgi:hypothetical protein